MQNEDPSEKLFISSSEILYDDKSDLQDLAKYSFDEFLSKYWDHIEKSILENNQRKKGSFCEILCEFNQFENILFFGRFDIPNDLQKYRCFN